MSTCLYLFQDAFEFGGWVAQEPLSRVGREGSRVVHASARGVEPCFGLSGWAPATVTVMELSLLFHEGAVPRSIDRGYFST
jgi:hypothetical protein